MTPRAFLSRLGVHAFIALVAAFFALPMLWLILAPFDTTPGLNVAVPELTLRNVVRVFDNPLVGRSLFNSLVLVLGTVGLVVLVGTPASYALSRARFRGRDGLLYLLLLFSSVVTGSAAMVPLFFLLLRMGMIDTYVGLILVLAGGMLPAAIFILKDFTDATPTSLEESARVFGASSTRILRDLVLPTIRPGVVVVGVWVGVNVWGNFLLPFILLRSPTRFPAAVIMHTFYTEAGTPDLRLLSVFGLLYTIPVVVLYAIVNRRYGFRFHGGIKR